MKKLAVAISIAMNFLVPVCASYSQTPEECLIKVRTLEAMNDKVIDGCRGSIHALIPDPLAYERALPSFEKVIADKDKVNLKNYGRLSEAYFYADDKVNGQRTYRFFSTNARGILGPDDTFAAVVGGDVGFLYFDEKNYSAAEPILLAAIKQMESHLGSTDSNNLTTDYMCMSLICDKAGKKAEASMYAKKLIDLATKQRQSMK